MVNIPEYIYLISNDFKGFFKHFIASSKVNNVTNILKNNLATCLDASF